MFNETYPKWNTPLKITSGLLLVGFLALLIFYLAAPKAGKNQPTTKTAPYPAEKYPAQILDLSDWKITLPVRAGDGQVAPQEIQQPQLAAYVLSPWFTTTPDTRGVVFRAPVNGFTTNGSDYPRSELREMTDNGTKDAYWSSKTGTHIMFLEEAITAVPKNKHDVVAGQLHGDDDDLLVIRLEYPKLYISRGNSNLYTLDENYTLGKIFNIKFVTSDGKIMVYYNDSAAPVYSLDKKVNKAYFKAGVYTQSNCSTEESPDLCNADNYGEVIIYKATVTSK